MDRLEVHQDALQPGSRVMIVDDLLLLVERRVLRPSWYSKLTANSWALGLLSSPSIYKGKKLQDVPIVTLVEY